MTMFERYQEAFPHAKLSRSAEGVLEVMLHTNGDSLVFNGYAHEEFVELFQRIGEDVDNRAVILTGAGDAFIDRIEADGFDFFTPTGFDKIYREGKKVLANLLDILGPGGPGLGTARRRSILSTCSSPTSSSRRRTRYSRIKPTSRSGSCPATAFIRSGPRSSARSGGRTFVLTRQVIDAEEAKRLGVIGEIVPRARLLERAREVAAEIAKLPPADRALYPRRAHAKTAAHRGRKRRLRPRTRRHLGRRGGPPAAPLAMRRRCVFRRPLRQVLMHERDDHAAFADAGCHRFTDPERTSPTAKMPGTAGFKEVRVALAGHDPPVEPRGP